MRNPLSCSRVWAAYKVRWVGGGGRLDEGLNDLPLDVWSFLCYLNLLVCWLVYWLPFPFQCLLPVVTHISYLATIALCTVCMHVFNIMVLYNISKKCAWSKREQWEALYKTLLEPRHKKLMIQCANPGFNGSVKKSLKEVKGRAEDTWSGVLEGASNKG